jgi:glycosyltransferase involved in cell wall biosynthesis
MRISLFVHDLASNPIVRAAPLARAFQHAGHEVHIVGTLLSGADVYAPYRNAFEITAIPAPLAVQRFLPLVPRLARLLTGDIVVACKPLATSFLPALVAARVQRRRPLILDVEDDEFVGLGRDWRAILWRDVIKGWRHITAAKYTWALHLLTASADAVIVSSRVLQRRHGGTVLRHGPDESLYAPERPEFADMRACRARFGLPDGPPLALFAGVSQSHKGLSVLIDALEHPQCAGWHLALAGALDQPDFADAAARLGARCHRLGLLANADMPALLAAATAVPLPQLDTRFARAQVPAKLIEAMAMARPAVASAVGDLPEILGYGTRGWIVPPGDAAALADALTAIARCPAEAGQRGVAARRWFESEASTAAMAATLAGVLNDIGTTASATTAGTRKD